MFDEGVLNFMGVMLSLVLAGGVGYGMIIMLNALQQKLTGGTSDVRQELAEVKQRLEHLETSGDDTLAEDMDSRLAELEDRLEFAERLLADKRGQERLAEVTPVPKEFPQ